ncbi:MAG: Acetyl-coenzyme A carboxylase carboxyl transferase subunit beta, chloroplastic [Fimbriimonadaceae bacterium]|nr:Acetyl-coenzyme A carboxylase carboxyl transferase subunit beta, chloroplastic [Fimbriimonadaceae bacterium]
MSDERPPWVCEDCGELATGDMCEHCGNIPPVLATGAPAPQLTPGPRVPRHGAWRAKVGSDRLRGPPADRGRDLDPPAVILVLMNGTPGYPLEPMRSGASAQPSSADAFLQCTSCKKILFKREFEANLHVCTHCGHHHRLSASKRIEVTFDPGSFQELDQELMSGDPLQFPDYHTKLSQSMTKFERGDGIVSGRAMLNAMAVTTAVSDFGFMGGSMGSVAGEKITRTLERAAEEKCPCIIFCASGGARMQEGLLSLMQMAKTTAAVERCREAGAPFVAVFTDPTMAGVLASYASVADIIFAEPKAMIGFAGARVSKQAQVVKAQDDFQTAEFCYKHGMVDRIVPRRELRDTLIQVVGVLGGVRGQ